MLAKQKTPEQITVYDCDDLPCSEDIPSKVIGKALRPLIAAMIEDQSRARLVNHGIEEIIENVILHGEESHPRLVVVQREMGGLAIDTVNTIKPDSANRGLGHVYIEGVFGDDYSATVVGDTYMGHLYIPRDASEVKEQSLAS